MTHFRQTVVDAVVVDETFRFSLAQLCRACRVDSERLVALVEEGVLRPEGDRPASWEFSGPSLARARAALRLSRDLELDASGVALVLGLLDEIAELRSRLQRFGNP